MPYFSYQAQDATGNTHKGIIEAPSITEAVKKLRSNNLFPIKIKQTGRQQRRKVPEESVIAFCKDLSDLLRAGLPMDRSLAILTKQESAPVFKDIINEIFKEVQQGANLSEAVEKHQDALGPLVHHMIRAGEASGTLEAILNQLSSYLERKRQFRQNLISSSIYPVLLLVMSLFSMTILLVYVIPRFAKIFEDLHQEVPAITQILLKLGILVEKYGWTIPVILGILFFTIRNLVKSPHWKKRLDQLIIKIPIVSKLVTFSDLSRFFMTLGTMSKAGVPLLKAISLGLNVVSNTTLVEHLSPLYNEVKTGKSLSSFFSGNSFFPVRIATMVKLAEEKGELGQTLIELGEYFERETEKILQRIIALMEPAIIIGTGLVIGTMVLSMFSAIIGISDVQF